MKRKKSKLIGLTLIISAVLLQVAYAATSAVAGVTSTEGYDVQIESHVTDYSKYVNVNLKEDEVKNGLILVEVDNLYPGAYFIIDSTVKNLGNPIKLVSIEVKHDGRSNEELYKNLVFYDKQDNEITPVAYKDYLKDQYGDGKISKDGTKVFQLKVGLSSAVTDLENETTIFLIEIKYEQDIIETGGGSGGDFNSGGSENPGEIAIPENEPEIIDEIIPAEPVITEVVNEDKGIEVVDEAIPGSPVKLPKTGGVGALLVYALGLTMLGGGISLYRKGKKDE